MHESGVDDGDTLMVRRLDLEMGPRLLIEGFRGPYGEGEEAYGPMLTGADAREFIALLQSLVDDIDPSGGGEIREIRPS